MCGHFARECWDGEGAKNKPKNQANLAKDDASLDSDVVMLMVETSDANLEETLSW